MCLWMNSQSRRSSRRSEDGWLGLMDDFRNLRVFELPGFVCELCRGTLSAAIRKANHGVAPAGAKTDGWGAWIRTMEWGLQRPLPYHLATPQRRESVAKHHTWNKRIGGLSRPIRVPAFPCTSRRSRACGMLLHSKSQRLGVALKA